MKQQDRKSLTFRQMTRGAYFYQAPLPAGGFRWRDDLQLPPRETITGLSAEAFHPPWLVGPFREGLGEPESNPLLPPKGEPGLHRRFTELWSEQSILEFANQYGHLLPVGEMAPLAPPSTGLMDVGESLAQWQAEIATCRRLLRFWDLARTSDKRELRRYVTWHSKDSVSVVWFAKPNGETEPFSMVGSKDGTYRREPLALPGRHTDLLDRWDFGTYVEPMRFHVHVEVNKRLRGVSPHVLPYVGSPHKITFIPDSLRAALYLLFALELAGETETRICGNEKCLRPGGLFTPATMRAEYCSDACRKQAHDLRKARQRRTSQQGVTNGKA